MDIASELRLAGLTVVEGRQGIGRTSNVAGIDVVSTKTGAGYGIAADINDVVSPAGGVAYIERGGRVWLLADGPVDLAPNALVFMAQQKSSPTDNQKDSLAVVLAVLDAVYAADAPPPAPDAPQVESESNPVEPEGEGK